jgi:inosine/xanthosine triphosphatase
MKKVIVASKNPVKINAVKIGFEKMFPDESFVFEGVSVPSGVKDQPVGNHEILTGAHNRAKNAKATHSNADYWVGVEGGVDKIDNEMHCFAWIVVMSEALTGKARSGTFFLPDKVAELVDQGKELGDADDIVFGRSNSKQDNGAVGILTNNVHDRTKLYAETVVLSLIPFKNSGLYYNK